MKHRYLRTAFLMGKTASWKDLRTSRFNLANPWVSGTLGAALLAPIGILLAKDDDPSILLRNAFIMGLAGATAGSNFSFLISPWFNV